MPISRVEACGFVKAGRQQPGDRGGAIKVQELQPHHIVLPLTLEHLWQRARLFCTFEQRCHNPGAQIVSFRMRIYRSRVASATDRVSTLRRGRAAASCTPQAIPAVARQGSCTPWFPRLPSTPLQPEGVSLNRYVAVRRPQGQRERRTSGIRLTLTRDREAEVARQKGMKKVPASCAKRRETAF